MRLVPLAVLVPALLSLASCDSAPLGGGDTPFVYATSGTDTAVDLVQTPSGDIVVVGSTEGRPRPADGTLARPSVLRFGLDGELLSAEVYRDVDYGDVRAVTWSRDGLVVSLAAGPDGEGDRTVGVFRADAEGRRRGSLLEFNDGFIPNQALTAATGGGVTAAVHGASASDPHLYRLDADGAVLWQARLDGAQDIRGLAEAPEGDVYIHGPSDTATRSVIARLDGETGQETWRLTRPEGWGATGIARTAEGVVLVEDRSSFQEGSEVRVVWLGADGREVRTAVVAREPGSPDGEAAPEVFSRGGAVAALAGGGVALSVVTGGRSFETPPRVSLVVLRSDGSERTQRRFGVEGRWAEIGAITALADGRVAVAGSVGPERVSGYGGDDFDVWLSLYEL